MTLRLWIENVDRLPDGGPLRVEVKGRGLDMGRDTHLDWTLPDPSRSVSSKHCEIRFRDGGYWLHDVSTNGTYVNGAQFRLDSPYELRDGDRLSIGPYIIAVEVEGQPGARAVNAFEGDARSPAGGEDVWGGVGEAAEPDDRSAYRIAAPQEPPPDFLDFASSIAPSEEAPAAPSEPDDWLSAPPVAAPAVPPPSQPQPRRPTAPPTPAAAPPSPTSGSDGAEILRRIARAAGIPEQTVADRDPDAMAEEIGLALRLTAQNLQLLLTSRAELKTLMRSSSRTMISVDSRTIR